jgi:hypothetical protein
MTQIKYCHFIEENALNGLLTKPEESHKEIKKAG